MKRLSSFFLCVVFLLFVSQPVSAQMTKWRESHKVKKKETLYSISREYGVTIDELSEANPQMKSSGYQLKKGDVLNIPLPKKLVSKEGQLKVTGTPEQKESSAKKNDDVRKRAIRIGVMLPLHDVNGDGRRMVEYYRGILMACDSLKKLGISSDIYAWNLAEDSSVTSVVADPNAARCDLIFGPLYSKQVHELSKFVKKNDIKLVIPFSIDAPDLKSNNNMFQVYQAPSELVASTVRRFCDWFKDYHPIIVDCGDTTSTKGSFTSALRKMMDQRGISYSLTSLKNSTDESFAKAFDVNKKNVVVLNTSRSPELNVTFGRLSAVATSNPDIHIAMFGYTEWLMYTQHQLENFYKYNVYLPAPFYTNLFSTATERLQQKYRWNFHQDMMQSLPRFALTGFDHAYFFMQGLHKYGMDFDGTAGKLGIQPVQTPLKFEREGKGGYQNRAYMFIHYMPEHKIESVNY
jgi:LysM repeat protein